MKNKKAWVRIVEAVIAITLLFGILTTLYVKSAEKPNVSQEIYALEQTLLNQISNNENLRIAVIKYDNTTIINLVNSSTPKGFESQIKICELNAICSLDNYKKEVYSSESIISSSLTEYSPKIVKIFIWKK